MLRSFASADYKPDSTLTNSEGDELDCYPSDTMVENQWVEIAFQAIWECPLWAGFCRSQLYYLTGRS